MNARSDARSARHDPARVNLQDDDMVGTITTARHSAVRYRAGQDSGDLFEEGQQYDGLTLTIEVADAADAQAMLDAICEEVTDRASGDSVAEAKTLVEIAESMGRSVLTDTIRDLLAVIETQRAEGAELRRMLESTVCYGCDRRIGDSQPHGFVCVSCKSKREFLALAALGEKP